MHRLAATARSSPSPRRAGSCAPGGRTRPAPPTPRHRRRPRRNRRRSSRGRRRAANPADAGRCPPPTRKGPPDRRRQGTGPTARRSRSRPERPHRALPAPARAVGWIPDITEKRRHLFKWPQSNRVRQVPKLPSSSSRHLAPSRRCPTRKGCREKKAGKGGSILDAY